MGERLVSNGLSLPGYFIEANTVEGFVSIVRADHPRIRGELSLEEFAGIGHVLVAPGGVARGVVDETLEERGLSRRVAVSVAHFMAAPAVVAASDHICMLPRRLVHKITAGFGLKVLEPPIPVPTFDLQLLWHERTQRDPAFKWLRDQFFELTADW